MSDSLSTALVGVGLVAFSIVVQLGLRFDYGHRLFRSQWLRGIPGTHTEEPDPNLVREWRWIRWVLIALRILGACLIVLAFI